MFGNCLWYRFNKNSKIHHIVDTISDELSTQKYDAHITKLYNLDLVQLKKKFLEFNSKELPEFTIKGNLYQTKTDNFYSIQQDYTSENDPYIYHVSLAYKLNKAFTKAEIDYIKTCKLPEKINNPDIYLDMWNCNSYNTVDWFKI